MKVNQVYEILNPIVKQITGQSDLAAVNTQTLVDIGTTITGDTILKEQFYKTLWDRIGKTIITQRAYSPQGKDMIMNTFEYGAMLQKLYIAPMEAGENPSWNDLTDGEYNMVYLKKATVEQDIFENRSTWEIDTAIPDIQINTAFLSESAFAAFIDGIYLQLDTSMKLQIEALASSAYLAAIAQRIANKSGNLTVVDLSAAYTAYQTAAGTTASYADFLRFSASMIKKVSDHMTSMSAQYNTKGRLRHTPKEYQRLTVLSDFASDMDVYLQSDVWHNTLTALPNYNTINYWQGTKGTDTTDSTILYGESIVNPRAAVNVEGQNTATANVVATLGDIQSVGMLFDHMRVRSIYDPRHEVTAIYSKGDKGYYFDPSENFVVFTVGTAVE